MRVHVVSDVHGAVPELARAAAGSDVFVCLGDLILFLDYDRPGRGIFADLFGEEHARAYIEARTANRFDEAHALSAAAWARLGVTDPGEKWALMQAMVQGAVRGALRRHAVPGAADVRQRRLPALWPDYLRDGHRVVDAEVVEVDGLRWGFVGGGLVSPMRTPYEIPEPEYAAKVAALGPVDVLFTHIPPALPGAHLRRASRAGSRSAARRSSSTCAETQPRYHLFGHVHQPLASQDPCRAHRVHQRRALPRQRTALRPRPPEQQRKRGVRRR